MKHHIFVWSIVFLVGLGMVTNVREAKAAPAQACVGSICMYLPLESAQAYVMRVPKNPGETLCTCRMQYTTTGCYPGQESYMADGLAHEWQDSCDISCEASYGAGLAISRAEYIRSPFYTPVDPHTSGDPYYQCPGTQRGADRDRDNIPSDADQDDLDYRVGVMNNGWDDCDGVDNDNDGQIDEGYPQASSTGFCSPHNNDFKRLWKNGHEAPEGQVNLRDGFLLRAETDVTIQTPYGSLPFVRYFNSGYDSLMTHGSASERELNPFGIFWSHSFNIWLAKDSLTMETGTDGYTLHMGNGAEYYFTCTEDTSGASGTAGNRDCVSTERRASRFYQQEFDSAHLQRRTVNIEGADVLIWEFFPGDGTVYQFSPLASDGDLQFTKVLQHVDVINDALIWEAEYNSSELLEYVRTADQNTYYYFTYDGFDYMDDVYVNVGGRGEYLMANFHVDATWSRLVNVYHAKDTIGGAGSISSYVRRKYEYATSGGNTVLSEVKDHTDQTTQVVTSKYTWHADGTVASVRGADIWSTFSYYPAMTVVDYLDSMSGDLSVSFIHEGGRYVYKREKDYHRSSIPRYIERDAFGRTSCMVSDEGVMTKYFYSMSGGSSDTVSRHTVIADYGTTGNCENEPEQDPQEPDLTLSNGVLQRVSWVGEKYDVDSKSWRLVYKSEPSQASNISPMDCQATVSYNGLIGMNNGCTAVSYEYQDSTLTHQAKGPLKRVRNFYYTEDATGTHVVDTQETAYFRGDNCTTEDPEYQYDWQVCRVEGQDVFGTVHSKTHYDYDSGGFIEASSAYTSASEKYTTKIIERDDLGRVKKSESPSGVVTDYTVDAFGTVTDVTVTGAYRDQSGADTSYTTSMTTNNIGLPIETVSSLGSTQVFSYNTGIDEFARTHAIVQKSPTNALLSANRVDQYTDQGFVRESNVIDIANEASCTNEHCAVLASRNVIERDAIGRTLMEHQFSSNTSYPADATSSYEYDPVTGQLTSWKDFVGNIREYGYDEEGRVEEIHSDITGLSATENHEYDDMNRPGSVTSPSGVETKFTYDDRDLLTKESSPSKGNRYLEYDQAGRLVRSIHVDYLQLSTHSSRKEVCYAYDWLGRLKTVDDDCDGNVDWTYVYDEAHSWCNNGDTKTNVGNLTTLVSDDYDGINRKWCYYAGGAIEKEFTSPTNEFWDDPDDADMGGFVLARGTHNIYDNAGRLTGKRLGTYPYGDDMGTLEVGYEYDAEHVENVSQIRIRYYYLLGWGNWEQITSDTLLPEYSVYGTERLVFANGTAEYYYYDNLGRTKQRFITNGTNAVVNEFHSFDENSNLLTSIDTGHMGISRFFEYDGLNRLKCESSTGQGCPAQIGSPLGPNVRVAYDYDLSNNRTRLRTELGGPSIEDYNAFTSSDRLEYYEVDNLTQFLWYDDQGNVEAINYPTQNTDHFYLWNVHGQMVKACADGDYFSNGLSNCTFRDYEYAGPGGQLFARYDGSIPGIGVQTGDRQFYWSGAQLDMVREFDGNDEKLGYYIWLGNRPIAKVDATMEHVGGNGALPGSFSIQPQQVTWIHSDYVGAPKVATDDTGNVVWEWDRTPYGRNMPSGSVEIDVRFPGQVYDEFADANYNQHRWYSSHLGQYLSPDPIGIAGGINYYGYADGNPTTRIDTYGQSGCPAPSSPYEVVICVKRIRPLLSQEILNNQSGPAPNVVLNFTPAGPPIPNPPAKGAQKVGQAKTATITGDLPEANGVTKLQCPRTETGLADCEYRCDDLFNPPRDPGTLPITRPYCPSRWYTPHQPDGGFNTPSMRLTACSYYEESVGGNYFGVGACSYIVDPYYRWGKKGKKKQQCYIIARTAVGGVKRPFAHVTSKQDDIISTPILMKCRELGQ